MMQQRERELLFERGFRRRGYLDAIMTRRVEHQLLLGHVEKVEELEVAVECIEPRLAAILVTDEEAILGKRNFFGPAQPGVGKMQTAKRGGEPRHLVAIIGRFVGNDDRDGRIFGACD